MTLRLTPEQIKAIDEVVERKRKAIASGEVTRASVLRYWVERGLAEEARQQSRER